MHTKTAVGNKREKEKKQMMTLAESFFKMEIISRQEDYREKGLRIFH